MLVLNIFWMSCERATESKALLRLFWVGAFSLQVGGRSGLRVCIVLALLGMLWLSVGL